MATKCLIVDDEPLAREVVKTHLENFDDIEIVAECDNALEAGKLLREKSVDLMFLDIEMPKISGFDFLNDLKNPPKVIIITAYRNYALKGYEFDVVDYLLKPVSFDRFYKAVNKFYKMQQTETVEVDLRTEDEGDDQFLYLNEDKTIHKIYLGEIRYIESFREYIKVHTGERAILTKVPISKIEEKLKLAGFARVHKSYIVSVRYIRAFNAGSVYIGDAEIPIGRTYKENVMKALKFDPNLL
jgi:DNA-binding LytR/AlgR family response regulator